MVADTDGDTVTLSVSGSDSDRFNIDETSGALSFAVEPDYESPIDEDNNNDYEVTVSASDGTDSVSQAVTITVTDVNEAPRITTINSSASEPGINSISVAEAQTSAFTLAATDPDSDNLTYTLSGCCGNHGSIG